MRYKFNELENVDLIIDAVYEGGSKSDFSSEPLHKLFPKCGVAGGFRKVNRNDSSGKIAYVVLYTSMKELEWPDYLDEETGILRYYGDNRTPGKFITDTKQKGNELLETIFQELNTNSAIKDIPPFFIFKKDESGRNVRFLGLAVPGNPALSSDKDLVSFWRTVNKKRFQNYEAYFTILDTGREPILRKWINSLLDDNENNLQYAPDVWKQFLIHGRNGIQALKSPKIINIPNKDKQISCDEDGVNCLSKIRDYYKDNPYGFELCAVDILKKLDMNFIDIELTRPWRDGGYDAVGYYVINGKSEHNFPLKIECAIEAKCYSEKNSVGVKEMSRLISRIRHRQFGVLITTSYVNNQAYSEVTKDGHPIMIITASDIARILRENFIDSSNILDWLQALEDKRFL